MTKLNCLLYFVKKFWNSAPKSAQQRVDIKPTKARNNEKSIKVIPDL